MATAIAAIEKLQLWWGLDPGGGVQRGQTWLIYKREHSPLAKCVRIDSQMAHQPRKLLIFNSQFCDRYKYSRSDSHAFINKCIDRSTIELQSFKIRTVVIHSKNLKNCNKLYKDRSKYLQ